MNRGFTLIELLVVIAIIAILAAILFPVFARAREKARQASCQSNLKQVALAFLMYVQDYDEKFPFWRWDSHGGGGTPDPSAPQWYVRLYPYVKNTQLFVCPSRSDNGGCRWCMANPDDARYVSGMPEFRQIHYGYNEVITNGWGTTGPPIGLADLKYPAEQLLVGDCRAAVGGWQYGGILNRYAAVQGPSCGCPPDVNMFLQVAEDSSAHNGGSNIGFCDGHVKWVRWNKISHGPGLYYWLP
ncbi:MAG: DUF1559 domain-containing protein [Armatimonadetes bacterium]|nr:DUF1559 domain-containing protein [Armatimonadota bacterium]